MDICFYDNNELAANEKGIVSVDRVYCLNFHEFIGTTWEQLRQVYLALPHMSLRIIHVLCGLARKGYRLTTYMLQLNPLDYKLLEN
ncbi:hypothetical protein M5X11_15835 [Paenibacillus alginolyticus]|uniref:hypothetical protein n=1 Tax=Paenibacillus alginolyticus TaxID=59839 RepID=UPI00040EFD47|nr:hypothetical protein [Paenibacillus alginolyticus]MCY9666414.1 hypothetical protein [Paenibacillus alginolyticus]